MIHVLIVDDHPIVRRGLRAELSRHEDIIVVGDAASGEDALVLAREFKPDIVVLDISLPDKNGLEVLSQLNSEFGRTRVLMLSTYPEKQYAIRCIKAGAWGYVTKNSAAEELVIAIRKVAEGKKYVSEKLGEILATDIGTRSTMPHERLSPREYEVLCLIGSGKTLSEIAESLSLSVSTVSTHRMHVLSKMRCQTTPQLVRYAIEHHLVEPHE
jgi:two-component system, NarL family, invasion response regulator UvrY